MSLPFNPMPGTIVICDFRGFVPPEMVKRRPAIVVSPRLRRRDRLCTVVPISTTPPNRVEDYHHLLKMVPPLPRPFDADTCWVKADMLYTVSYDRLDLPHEKNPCGKRIYITRLIPAEDLREIRQCILFGLGLNS